MRLSYQDSALTSMKGITKGFMKDILKGIARSKCMTIHDGVRTRVTVQPLALLPVPWLFFPATFREFSLYFRVARTGKVVLKIEEDRDDARYD